MNTSTSYGAASRNSRVKVATLVAAAAAAAMIVAGIGAEAISRGGFLQPTTGDASVNACRAARDLTLPIQLQMELQAQCADQVVP